MPRLNVVYVDGMIRGASDNLTSVSREAYGPDLSARKPSQRQGKGIVTYAETAVPAVRAPIVPAPHVREVQRIWLGRLLRICWSKTYGTPDRTVSQISIVWAQRRICDSPLPIIIEDRFVVFPFVWVRRVIHANLEILRTREEEIAVVGKLTGITSMGVMYDRIRIRGRNEALSSSSWFTMIIMDFERLPETSVYFLSSVVYRLSPVLCSSISELILASAS